MNNNHYPSVTDVVGYTHSDGYALCPMHARYGRITDYNNESGHVQPIFLGDETDNDMICDVCNEVILEANIVDEEEEENVVEGDVEYVESDILYINEKVLRIE